MLLKTFFGFYFLVFLFGIWLIQWIDHMWTRWGGQKLSVFVHAQGIKTVHAGGGGGGQKMAKFCPSSCWMTPKKSVCEWNPLSCVLNLDTKLGERPNWNPSIKVSLLLHLVLYEEPDNNELGWPVEMNSSCASPSCEGSQPSLAKLGHFNFRAETELTILTICMSKNSKFLTYFPILLLYHDFNQFHAHLLEFM